MSSSQRDADVIVVGSAVAGSAAASAFGKLGPRVLVLEKGAERDNSTRGDILHPPTLRFLEPWGALDALHQDGALPITHLAVTHRELGRLATYPIEPADQGPAGRSLAVPHDRIEAVMKACAQRWPSVTVLRANVHGLVREAGRVCGVRARVDDEERTYRAPLVIGCDGSQSLVRREAGIGVDRQPYSHELLYIAADGVTDPPAAMHFFIDDSGVIMTASRPRGRMRIAIYFERGARGDLLKRPDPALHDYVTARVPALASARFTRENAHIYSLVRQLADQFHAPGVALAGDAAHTTHPTGATGMNLAIAGATRLSQLVGPLLEGASTPAGLAALDRALAAYTDERRTAAGAAIEQNHLQALRIWQGELFRQPEAYARAIDPKGAWGVGGAGWGQNPAALADVVATGAA